MSTKYNCILLLVLAGLCDLYAGVSLLEKTEDTHVVSRVPRRSGLCPNGMSRETCFFSQLNMFMKIHDSMMDPVSLRNIGKRNGVQDTAYSTEESIPKDILAQYQDISSSVEEGDPISSENSRDSLLYNLNKATKNLEGGDRINLLKLLRDYERHFVDTDHHGNNDVNEDTAIGEVTKRGQTTFLPPQKKRHIICPASMSRIECYDQAMAFYMRLMRSVGKQ